MISFFPILENTTVMKIFVWTLKLKIKNKYIEACGSFVMNRDGFCSE